MKLHELPQQKERQKSGRRIGRGRGSTKGKTSGGGIKGQKVRNRLRLRRLQVFKQFPKLRGKQERSKVWSAPVQIVTLASCNALSEKKPVTQEVLHEQNLILDPKVATKILGNGTLEKSLTFSPNLLFSKNAREKITKAGGKIE